MGLFISLCKNCDEELHWFLEFKKGIKCRSCGTHNTEKIYKNQWFGGIVDIEQTKNCF